MRFLGRRVYVAAVVIVASVVALAAATASAVRRVTGIAPRTARRWLQWWRGPFPETHVFVALSARLVPSIPRDRLPTSVLARLTGSAETRLTRMPRSGDLFGVPLASHNRWAGFKALRARWADHVSSTRYRPVLIVDEAQETLTTVFSELRILASKDLDSKQLLCVVFAGDARLPERLRAADFIPFTPSGSPCSPSTPSSTTTPPPTTTRASNDGRDGCSAAPRTSDEE